MFDAIDVTMLRKADDRYETCQEDGRENDLIDEYFFEGARHWTFGTNASIEQAIPFAEAGALWN